MGQNASNAKVAWTSDMVFASLDQSRDVFLLVEAGRVVRANAAWSTLTGRAMSDLVGEDLAASIHPEDVFALASRAEGSPVALIEAMAAGLPVLATTIPGVNELLTGSDAAVLVDPDDGPGATAALAALCSDPARRTAMGAAAQALVRARRSIDLEVARTESLYLELLWTR